MRSFDDYIFGGPRTKFALISASEERCENPNFHIVRAKTKHRFNTSAFRPRQYERSEPINTPCL